MGGKTGSKNLAAFCLICLVALSMFGCSSTTPTEREVDTIPFLLRYTSTTDYQDQLLKVTWNTKTGTVEIDTSTTLAFPNYASESNFWVTLKPWIGLPLQPPERNSLSNTAIYWDGSDTATLFTTEKDLFVGLQENNFKANIVNLTATSMCNQFNNMTNCYTTPNKLYAFERGSSNSAIYRFSSTEAVKTTVSGYAMGIGAEGNTTYVLSASETQSSTGPKNFLNIQSIKADGTLIEKKVANSERKEPYSSDADGLATFANGSFYLHSAKVNTSSDSPKFELVQSLIDAFKIISTSTSLESFGGPYPSPAFYGYKGYTIVVGSTFSPDEITVALFKNEELLAFAIITPIYSAETKLTTYDSKGKELSAYSIQTPVQVVIPQS